MLICLQHCIERSNIEIIVAGDCDINILKIFDRPIFKEFFASVILHSFYPDITLLSGFTDHSYTLSVFIVQTQFIRDGGWYYYVRYISLFTILYVIASASRWEQHPTICVY